MQLVETSKEIGERLTLEECDEFGMSIRGDFYKVEAPLMHGKWFDYRFLHPVQATYLYAHEFEKAYREAYTMNIDQASGPYVRAYKDRDLRKCPKMQISGLWKGRQIADACGMPYPIFVRLAFQLTLKYWARSHLPRPTQIYSDRVTNVILDQWEERLKSRAFIAEDPFYTNDNYEGHKFQNDHHEWLFSLGKYRSNEPEFLAGMIRQDYLPSEKVLSRLGDKDFQKASSYLQ